MSEAEPAKVTEEQEQKEGAAEESTEEKPQSLDGMHADPGTTPHPDHELKVKEDCTTNSDRAPQVKMQSIFTQVRNQIKSQVGMDFQRKGILNIVERVTREKARENEAQKSSQAQSMAEGETKGEGMEEGGKTEAEGENKAETAIEEILEGGLATLRGELLASIETLRNDFKEEMAMLRAESREYTDKAVKGLEAKALSAGPNQQKTKLQRANSSGQQLQPGANTQKSVSMPSVVLGRPRMLNRTMTTLNPKTCHSVALGPRSKSEAYVSPDENGGGARMLESSDFHVLANRGKNRSKAGGNLPPACPTLRSNKKLVRSKARTGNSTTK